MEVIFRNKDLYSCFLDESAAYIMKYMMKGESDDFFQCSSGNRLRK